jgi:hypothetical protein
VISRQLLAHPLALLEGLPQRLAEQLRAAAATLLGAVHRDVRVADHVLCGDLGSVTNAMPMLASTAT